jgi:hypothetical protein
MDDKSNELLQQILIQQKEQTDLLRRNLGRIRFSLKALLFMMTFACLTLTFFIGVFLTPRPIPSRRVLTTPTTAPFSFPNNMPPVNDGNRRIPDRTAE